MTVTPEQIEGASFSTVKRGGYRTEEVDRFLRTLADEYRSLSSRVRAAEGANEDLQAASNEMATLMRDVHAQLGERRRDAELEIDQMRQAAEREAAGIISASTEQADTVRKQADRALADAEHHAGLLRSDGEQRVREQAQETLRAARAELQQLMRRKHEIQHALSALRTQLSDLESGFEQSALSPEALDDNIVNQTLIDLRQREASAAASRPSAVAQQPAAAVPPPPPPPPPDAAVEQAPGQPTRPAPAHEARPTHPSHPSQPAQAAGSSTFFSPPDNDS